MLPYACPRTCPSADKRPRWFCLWLFCVAWCPPCWSLTALTENLAEAALQGNIHVRHAGDNSEIGQAGHAMLGHAAGHNAGEMRQVRVHIQRHAMQADPALDAHAQGGDLVFSDAALHPDSYAAGAALALDAQFGQSPDQPFLQIADIGAHIGLPALQ